MPTARTAWVNTKALRLAKISRVAGEPGAAGTVVRDPRTGEPTGLLEGSAVALVERLLPAPTAADRDRALRAAIESAHRLGVTSVQDVAESPEELAGYAGARRTGDLQVRMYVALPVTSDLADADLDRLEVTTRKFPDDPLLKAGAISVPLDDGRGAAPGQRPRGRPRRASTPTRSTGWSAGSMPAAGRS